MNPNQRPFQLNQFSSFQLPPLQRMSVAPKQQLEAAKVAGANTKTLTKGRAQELLNIARQQFAKVKAQPRTINQTQSQAQAQKPKSVLSSAEQDYQKMLNKELEKAYKSGVSRLEGDVASLTTRQPELETQVETQFTGLVPGVERQRETALAEARRQFETGLQRGQQVFGGVSGSSAAQAVQDIASQELLRQTGNIQTQTAEALNKINTDKQNALIGIRQDFRKQLDAINSQRYELASQKSNAQLQALQDFAQRRRNLEDFYTQRQASLEDQLRATQQAGTVATPKQASYLTSLGFDDAGRKQAIDSFIKLGEGYLARQNLRRAVVNGREVLQDTNTGETFDVETGANITIY